MFKRHIGLKFGRQHWFVVGMVNDVNESSWTAVLEAQEEQTKEGALRNGHLRSW